MMSADSSLLMLGLRGSGKTTYLASIWHSLETSEVADRLTIPQLQPDRDYLNSIRNNWLALRPVGRTSMRVTAPVSMSLFDKVDSRHINISMPDLSGESFRLQWATRKAPKAYIDFARASTGAFLFIHPAEVRRTHAIKASNPDGVPQVEGEKRIPASQNWTPEETATQVQLVDILQLLLGMRTRLEEMRISVIISAWDTVKARISPIGWLETRLPLLSQYLASNEPTVRSEIFGVSAQGGDLSTDKDRLLAKALPSARAICVRGNSLDQVTITAPLQFLLG